MLIADETYQGKFDAAYRGGSMVAQLEPTIFISAMAAVTKSVSFGITGSTSYIPPYTLARTWSTLDHVTNGRVGWNVVTSYSNTAAQAFGRDSVTPHDQRYIEADEYMELCYALWEGSWEDGAQIFDPKRGAYDPSKVHKIKFDGLYHRANAVGQAHPSPQRTPLVFQAGSSPSGKAFAAKHAEAVFCGGGKPQDTAPFVKSVREAAAANGRDPTDIKFFPQITPILGRTLEEAQAKYERYKKCIDYEGGLSKISNFVNFDFSTLPLDEPFIFDDSGSENSIHTLQKTLKRYDKDGTLTPRKVGEGMAYCGFAPKPVGTPEMIADLMEQWMNEADIDGFNVSYVSNPESYEDVVELLVPELQRRGLMWDDYAVPGGTFRENMHRAPGEKLLPKTHPAEGLRYENLKMAGKTDAAGHVVIDKAKEAESLAEGSAH
ncbi:bacterial luciferase-like protein [Coleophoma cylindrospora]|uniref:Bacterial luciferase-like protein n=1 Tax=Coleophoma cylindrospora TaxID=1849047 RepID=A0A3D8SPR0_9HELO|nr:bacterial luciferase-like protein [Coleophoma cylindrospora]